MNTRQLITGMFLAVAAFLAYQWIISWVYPPRRVPPAATQPAVVGTAPEQPIDSQLPSGGGGPPTAPATATAPRGEFAFSAGRSREPVKLGGRPGDVLELTLTPRGAGVESMRLAQRRGERYVYRDQPGSDEPCEVLEPVLGATGQRVSFETHEILIREQNNRTWRLDELVWDVAAASAERVEFATALRAAGGEEQLLRLSKTYELQPGQPLVNLTLTLANPGQQPLTVTVSQNGPLGIRRESPMYDTRRLIVAQREGQSVKLHKAAQRSELAGKANQGQTVRLFTAGSAAFAWTALTNRFFGVFTRPLPGDEGHPPIVQSVEGTVALPDTGGSHGDLVARLVSAPIPLAPGGQAQQRFEVYIGPKDEEVLRGVNAEFVEQSKVGYTLACSADTGCCTFQPLPQIMTALLHWIQFGVRNYGIAIIILVLIVRTCLHPLSVYQQKQMYRMQDSMARLQPKLEALKEQHKNDKVRLNQEMMKLYADEGVNPMASLIGMLPLIIQMPILVALWTGLNTDIHLRHAPFDGWWIKDLAAPDALITFAAPVTIPMLGQLPWLGSMFRDIPGLNLLPLLMGVSMWLQQKYMPKPGMHARAEAARKQPPAQRRPGQLTPEEQLRQQQMIGYMMTFLFPLMFYYMPSGLNLYWMATNVFGIGESLIIRKHLREEKERREREGPRPARSKGPGLLGRVFKRLAEQAEHIQRKADVLSEYERSGKPRRDANQKKP